MNETTQIVITVEQIWKFLLGFFGGITVILTAAGKIYTAILKAKAPAAELKSTVEEHSKILKEHETYFKKDSESIEAITKSNRVTQKALLAMIEYQMNGESTESLRMAKDEIQSFLINK